MLRLCLAVPIALGVASCAKNPRPTDDGAAPRHDSADAVKTAAASEPRGKVTLLGTRAEAVVSVEVVKSRPMIERGLMFREQLAENDGMLFLMPDEEIQGFWMKNTLIPLDLIFIGSDMKVVGIVENAEPKTTRNRSVGKPSRYVLEVNGGWSAKHGIGPGATVRFEGVEAIAK
jgi:uncharacterized protein